MCARTRIVSDFVATTKIDIQGQLGGRLPNQNVSSGNDNGMYDTVHDTVAADCCAVVTPVIVHNK